MVEIMTYVVFFIVLAIVVFITNIKGRGGHGGYRSGGGYYGGGFSGGSSSGGGGFSAAAEVSAAAVPAVNFNIESDVENGSDFVKWNRRTWYVRVYFRSAQASRISKIGLPVICYSYKLSCKYKKIMFCTLRQFVDSLKGY